MYTPVTVNIFNNQHDKLKNAVDHQKATSVHGKHTLLLTRGQIAKIERLRLIEKSKVTIHLGKRQVKANVQQQGGFLGKLADWLQKLFHRYSEDSRLDCCQELLGER